MCHSRLRRLVGEVGRLACKETVNSNPRCYRWHRIGRSNLEKRFRVAHVARQKEGLLHPLALVRLSGATPQRDLKVNAPWVANWNWLRSAGMTKRRVYFFLAKAADKCGRVGKLRLEISPSRWERVRCLSSCFCRLSRLCRGGCGW